MLQMQYIGLLNTDRNRREPIRMFIQGKHSKERYVLNCLPPWIAEALHSMKETSANIHYIPGINLDLLSQEVRVTLHKQLVESGYTVRALTGRYEYVAINEVFCP